MPWKGKDLGSIGEEAEKDFEEFTEFVAFKGHAEIMQETPVGNPALWKSGRGPKGYKGGDLLASWRVDKVGGKWLISSDRVYAAAIWVDGHSRRLYQGQKNAVDKVIQLMKGIKRRQ